MEKTILNTNQSNSSYSEFLKKLKNVDGPRKHKISNSIGMQHAFYHYRKNRPKDSRFVLARNQYDSIINDMNKLAADRLFENKSFLLPCGIGKLLINKTKSKVCIDDNGKLFCNKPVDRDKTYRLWYEDAEARLNKILVRVDTDEVFRFRYKKTGTLIAKGIIYFAFNFGRDLKLKMRDIILTDKNFDTYERKQMDRY